MNPLYDQLFNPQYVNISYLRQIEQQQHVFEQRQEIAKAVQAIRDYCAAARKIDPEFQEEAFRACIIAVLQETGKIW